ncbi:MAG TPA: hypothetical protein VL284_18615 [Thermoanaerobaculia bacterium]|nr:hypothetical protein [Thermoanaerobaculia bacterium]
MITIAAFAFLLAAADIPVARVAEDARAIDRVAEASKRDLPRDLLKRIVNDDIELLRGRRADGTYEFAGFERFEKGRASRSFSVPTHDETLEVHGSFVYKLEIVSPSRRLLVTRNRKVYLDHVEIDYVPLQSGATLKTQSVKIEDWIDAGQTRSVDFQEIAREATVRLFAHSDKKTGYGNVDLSLVEARVIDNADSPYADAVASAKAVLRGLDHDDISSIRAMSQRMAADLQPNTPCAVQPTVPAAVQPGAPAGVQAGTAPAQGLAATPDILPELQAIEDLLTGTEAERRDGMDRLHQLIRKLRNQPH